MSSSTYHWPFEPGEVEVWYQRPEFFRKGTVGEEPKLDELEATHVKLGVLDANDPDEVFAALQGESWSPNGEANAMLRALGLGHTSMSVGDVIVLRGDVLLVAIVGFRRLGRRAR